MKTRSPLLCALVAGLVCFGTSLRGADQPKGKTPWRITGQLEEACSCDAACPCWFNSKPTKMTCGGGQVLFIQKGNYGKVKLDGLAVATMAQSPEGQTMTYNDADQNWSWSNSNYMLGTFTVDSVQYEKFAAGLAQKMTQMKNEKASEKE